LTDLDLISITTQSKTVDLLGASQRSSANESRIRKSTADNAISIDDPSLSYQIVVEPAHDNRATPNNIF